MAEWFVPSSLLDGIDMSAGATRRLLVTSWLMSGGGEDARDAKTARAAVEFWHRQRSALLSWRPATVVTVLTELEQLGFVESFEGTEGGFLVKLKEVQA